MAHDGTGRVRRRFTRIEQAYHTSHFLAIVPRSAVSLCAKAGAGTGPFPLPAADLPEGWGIDRFPCSRLSPLDCFQEGMYDCEWLIDAYHCRILLLLGFGDDKIHEKR